jgi:hypothetical protein
MGRCFFLLCALYLGRSWFPCHRKQLPLNNLPLQDQAVSPTPQQAPKVDLKLSRIHWKNQIVRQWKCHQIAEHELGTRNLGVPTGLGPGEPPAGFPVDLL